MNRSLIILLGALALGTVIFTGSYFASQRACLICETKSMDDFTWLRQEYHLSDADMAHIRELHEAYLPKCAGYCDQIAAKKAELQTALAGGTNVTAGARVTLAEIADLRARCQAQMLQHFIDVSQAMPPEQGRRYLAEMQRLTLASPDDMEQSMSPVNGHEHPEPRCRRLRPG